MTEAPISLHPDDGEIIRWMDDALPPPARETMEVHFVTCEPCRSRRAVLERRTVRLSELLRAIDLPAPATALRPVVRRRRERSTTAWKVAATIILVLGGAAAVTPVRAWFVGVAKTVWARLGEASTKTSTEGSVSFVPTGPTLTIRVPRLPGATLTVEMVAGDRVTGVGGGSDVLVLPDELRFADTQRVTGDYVVQAPLRAETIRVVIGQAGVQVIKPRAVGDRWVIPLGN